MRDDEPARDPGPSDGPDVNASDLRTLGPAALLANLRPHLPALGITRLANVTGLDTLGIPTVMVVRPEARSFAISQGRGFTPDAARISGILDAVEAWHAERIEAPLRLASAAELGRNQPLAEVARLPGSAPAPDDRLLWIEGRELRNGQLRWLPLETVQLDLRQPPPEGSGRFLASPGGLAAGARLDEAIAHGLYELIERDGTTLFLGLPGLLQWQRRIDLATVQDDTCRTLLQAYRDAEVDVAVWDTSSDLGVASFLCLALDRVHDPARPVGSARGAGCHPSRSVALARALCEAAQRRLTRLLGIRDELHPRQPAAPATAESHARSQALLQETRPPPRDFREIPSRGFLTATQALRWTAEVLGEHDLPEVIVVDLSRRELPVQVVRVVVPGLEAFCELPGYQPGARVARQKQELGT